MARQKILYLINSLGAGGAEQSLFELLPHFESRGLVPLVVCFERSRLGVQSATLKEGYDVRFLEERSWLRRAQHVRRLIQSEAPALLHTTLFDSNVIGRIAAAGSRTKVLTSIVSTTYDPVRLQDPNVRAWRLEVARWLDGFTARHLTHHFHAITHAVKDAAVKALGIRPEDVTVIERGRDAARLGRPSAERRRQARRRLGLADDDEVILNVARQEYPKGQRHLLDAFEALAARRPRARLLIAGREGHASAELRRRLAALRAAPRISFLGHRDDVPELLAAADVFAFPSLYEGLGGALIEAMALGLPIVASRLPAIEEVVEEDKNALLVEPARPDGLAQALARVLEDAGLRSAFAARSREIFEARFTLERSVSRMIALYDDLLGRTSPPRPAPAPKREPLFLQDA